MTTQTIATQLRQDILCGKRPPGSDLPQAEIAADFGVSRIPVRDALGQLATQGLVTVTPNRGAHVLRMNATEIAEVFDLRVLLECDALARAIPALRDRDMVALDYALGFSNLEARTDRWADGDAMFHRSLYAPAHRPRQTMIIDRLRQSCQIHIAAYPQLAEKTDCWLADHAAIVTACKARNVDLAVDLLETHIRAAQSELAALIDEDTA